MYYKVTVFKKQCGIGRNNRQIDKWNRVESLEINLHKYSQLIIDKQANAVMKKVFSTNGVETTRYPYEKRKKYIGMVMLF